MSEALRKVLIDGEDVFLQTSTTLYKGEAINKEYVGIKSLEDSVIHSPSSFCKKYVSQQCNGWDRLYVLRDGKKVKLKVLRDEKRVSLSRNVLPNITHKKPNNVRKLSHNIKKTKKNNKHPCIPDKKLLTQFPGKNIEKPLDLQPFIDAVRKYKIVNKYKLEGKDLVGDATEYWFMENINCQRCRAKDWIKCEANTPAFDFECKICNTVYSIKSAQKDFFIKKSESIKIEASGRYSPLKNAHIKRKLDWILIYYDKASRTIKKVYYVPYENIDSDKCFVARKPLASHTKKPGWKGCRIRFSKEAFRQIIP